MARPDIAQAVGRVARHTVSPTQNTKKAIKQIIRYLHKTRDAGLEYSDEIETSFKSVYSEVAAEAGKKLGDVVAFSDSDF